MQQLRGLPGLLLPKLVVQTLEFSTLITDSYPMLITHSYHLSNYGSITHSHHALIFDPSTMIPKPNFPTQNPFVFHLGSHPLDAQPPTTTWALKASAVAAGEAVDGTVQEYRDQG